MYALKIVEIKWTFLLLGDLDVWMFSHDVVFSIIAYREQNFPLGALRVFRYERPEKHGSPDPHVSPIGSHMIQEGRGA